MCQLFVDWALQPIRQHFSDALIYHYMDNILIATKRPLPKTKIDWLISQLEHQGLTVMPEKIQRSAPWKYLGWLITDAQICPQKITLHDNITTLYDAQKLFGDLQCVQTIVGITNDDLLPFLPWLCGSDANSSRVCASEQQKALIQVSEKLQRGWSVRVELLPLSLFLSNAEACTLAIVFHWQKKKGENRSDQKFDSAAIVIEWMFLPVQPKCRVMSRTDAFAALIRKGRDRIVEIDRKEPADISIPVKDEDLEWLLRHSVALQEALLGFAVMGVPMEIKTDNGPAYVGQRVARFMQKWGVKHTTGIPRSSTGQAIVERANCTLKEYLAKQKQTDDIDVVSRLSKVLFTLNYLCLAEGREEPAVVIHHHAVKEGRPQAIPGLYVYYKNMQMSEWQGPSQVLFNSRGYMCVSTDAGPVWVLSRFTRVCPPERIPSDSENDLDDNNLPGTPSDDPEPDQN
ncbi:hypothetical protein HGM15179_019138 [Zosterops borbonicus]|uniref:ribonuclease H n=1 Tax=Zosterops borbonicus TaxID=364589 RepID=A0A8K1D9X8_9PASS|nr:hypothetical protein HGM15179_019138 [Zosterops borbonicus]